MVLEKDYQFKENGNGGGGNVTKKVRVAYFLEWPSPNLEDKNKKNFEKRLGVPVEWIDFTNGGAMTDAMIAGDIDISYSQGLVPFINGVKADVPIKVVDIAMEYGMGGTTCVTSYKSKITKTNAKNLEGKRVAVPLGTMAEYVFDETMKIVGADRRKMKIVNMIPERGADALKRGNVVMACLFGGNSIRNATSIGSRLLTVQEARDGGIVGIDVVTATEKFIKESPDLLRKFIKITHEANERYKKGESNMEAIKKESKITLSDMYVTISGFEFLTPSETSSSMLNGSLYRFMKHMGISDYQVERSIDTSFLPL